MNIAGLDLASKSGVVVVRGDEVLSDLLVHKVKGKFADRFSWAKAYGTAIAGELEAHDTEIVFIEAYGFSFQRPSSIVPLVELGTAVRFALHDMGLPMIEVAPTSLKKFVSGKGNTPKSKMMMETYKRWGYDPKDDNVSDAFGLAQMGRVLVGEDLPMPKVNLTSLSVVRDANPILESFYPNTV